MSTVLCTLASLAVLQPTQEAPLLSAMERTVAVAEQGFFPVAIRMNDGRIACVLRGGAPHIGIGGRLDLIYSSDGGRTWSAPVTVVDSEWDDRNPALGQMPDGSLVLGYGECQCYDPDGTWNTATGGFELKYIRSANGGVTWTAPQPLEHPFGPGCSPYGRIIVCADGRALMSVYGEVTDDNRGLFSVGPDDARDAVGLLVSTDSGRTWGQFTPVAKGYNETTFVEMPSGELVALARSDSDQHVAVLRSSDGGVTWTEPEMVALGSQHPADGQLLPSGEILMVYGSRLAPFGVHAARAVPERLAVAHRRALANDSQNTDQGYPSVVLLEDGAAVALYYAVGNGDRPGTVMALAVRFNPADLPSVPEGAAP